MNKVERRDRRSVILGIAGILLIVLFAFGYFLFDKDDGGITGLQALGQAGLNFWVWAIILTAAAFATWFLFYRMYDKIRDFGATRPVLIIGIAFMCIAWGKGCDIKESKGVTSEKGRVGGAPEADKNRQAAEDMLPK